MARTFAVASAEVLGAAEETPATGKTFTVFKVRVTSVGGEQWVTAKRFTEFKAVDEELGLAGVAVAAKLPKKKLRHTAGTLAKRQHALQLWLSSVVDDHGDHGCVVQFLSQSLASDDAPASAYKDPPVATANIFAVLEGMRAAKAEADGLEAPGGGADGEGEARAKIRQLLGQERTLQAFDESIAALEAEAQCGGPLAVGFCAAGGAVEIATLLESAGAMLPIGAEALALVDPDSPWAVAATGSLRILSLLSADGDFRANNRYIYSGLACSQVRNGRYHRS
jgi:hypothetical protein